MQVNKKQKLNTPPPLYRTFQEKNHLTCNTSYFSEKFCRIYTRKKETYEINKINPKAFLGQGTYGKVYLGTHSSTKKIVAIKLMDLSSINSEEEKEERKEKGKTKLISLDTTIIREITLLKELNHPNIIPLIDLCYEHKINLMCLIFPYIPKNLSQSIEEKSLSPRDICLYTYQLLKGLHYLHTVKNVIHRDLKPQNLLIDSEKKQLYIADFGLSRSMISGLSPIDYSPEVITLCYRAPELLLGDKKYSFAVDLWAVGCILIEMIMQENFFFYFSFESIYDHEKSKGRIMPLDKRERDQDIIQLKSYIYFLNQFPSWDGIAELPNYELLNRKVSRSYLTPFVTDNYFEHFKLTAAQFQEYKEALDLCKHLLCYDPSKRYDTLQALEHPYFDSLRRKAEEQSSSSSSSSNTVIIKGER